MTTLEPKARARLASLTVEQVRDELIDITYEVAREKGVPVAELSYSSLHPGTHIACSYTDEDGNPACLIGQWLIRRAGVPVHAFTDDLNDVSAQEIVRELDLGLSVAADRFLREVQARQDDLLPTGERRTPWLAAIQGAFEETPRLTGRPG